MNTKPSDPRVGGQPSASTTEDGLRSTRKARLEVIRSEVNSGSYDIPAMDIAESILDRTTGRPLPRRK